jgi:hypothetical protein
MDTLRAYLTDKNLHITDTLNRVRSFLHTQIVLTDYVIIRSCEETRSRFTGLILPSSTIYKVPASDLVAHAASQETVLDSKELSVSCPVVTHPVISPPSSPALQASYSQKVQFQARREISNKADAFGTFTYTFSQPIQRCTVLNGAYTIHDDPYLQSYVGYCNKAKGTFVSTADTFLQTTVVDPAPFMWEGQALVDPVPVTLPYFGFAEICDHTYLTKDRNYVRLGLTGFGTKTLTLDWMYKDQTGNRVLDFLFTMDCTTAS